MTNYELGKAILETAGPGALKAFTKTVTSDSRTRRGNWGQLRWDEDPRMAKYKDPEYYLKDESPKSLTSSTLSGGLFSVQHRSARKQGSQ